MVKDGGSLPNRRRRPTPQNRIEDPEPYISTFMTNKESRNGIMDEEIDELFVLRMDTYKKWASIIARKKCKDILIDHFKSDLSNDFSLMINWLASTNEKSRTILLESSCATKEMMDLDVALDLLVRMGLADDVPRGRTVEAFRELVAVLCGGEPGQIPELDRLALFTQASSFTDTAASEVIVNSVRTFFNFSNHASSEMGKTITVHPTINSFEAMRDALPVPDLDQPQNDALNFANIFDGDICETISISEDGGLDLICEDEASELAKIQSLPSNCINLEEPGSSTLSSDPTSAFSTKSQTKKTRRDMFLIKSRQSGREASHSLPEECFICEKSDGDLLHCGKKYMPGAYCSTRFHKNCIEVYNAGEYNVDCIRKIVDETFCPLHFCSSCYLERWKTTAVRGKLIECDSCYRAFHEECAPAGYEIYESVVGARSRDGDVIEVKQRFTRCHAHYDAKAVPLVINARSHLPFCCECENTSGEALTKCSLCVRSFHDGCLTLNCRDMENASIPMSVCESCILGENLRIGQAVIARFTASFYAATVASLADYPKHCAKKDKYGKHLGEPGYVCVKWAGCVNMFALLPARNIVPMFAGSFSLIGRRISEAPCREAWERMEDDLSITRPTFDYVPEKYIRIKTSVYHPSCPKPRLDACEESDSMCDCPPGDKDRCGPNSKCTNRAILQECPETCEAVEGGCNNRGVSRKEVNPAVQIREAPGKGLGAFAIKDIPKGSFIAEYAGELISIKEKNRRIAEVTAHKNAEEKHYMMALDSQRIIDCKEKGNAARFLNHSCSPNCKVETVYVVVSRSKRPNGATVKYDKRITICTIEDVPAGTELCFNYQMTQYNIGCPLPDCKCGAPNCTGTLGAITHEKSESDVSIPEVEKPKKKKQKRKAVSTIESPEKKRPNGRSRQSTPASSTPSSSRSSQEDEKAVINGRRKNAPTVTFRKGSLPSKLEANQVLKTHLPRSLSRDRRSINGLKDDPKLQRALLNGEALEKVFDIRSPSQKDVDRRQNGLRKARRIAAEISLANVVVS